VLLSIALLFFPSCILTSVDDRPKFWCAGRQERRSSSNRESTRVQSTQPSGPAFQSYQMRLQKHLQNVPHKTPPSTSPPIKVPFVQRDDSSKRYHCHLADAPADPFNRKSQLLSPQVRGVSRKMLRKYQIRHACIPRSLRPATPTPS